MFYFPPPEDENIGKYLIDVAEALIRDDDRKCRIALAKDLNRGDMNNISKEET